MRNSTLGIATVLFLAVVAPPASAAPTQVSGATALAVAAVVAQYSPLLNAGQKKLIAALFEGNTRMNSPKNKLSVSAATVMCRISDVAIAERSCEIGFTKGNMHSLKGRAANELYATLAAAGIVAEGAAGSLIESITKLSCTLNPGEIAQNAGGGADCSLESGQ